MKSANVLWKKMNVAVLLAAAMTVITACTPRTGSGVPADFHMMMDVHDADSDTAQNINIQIDASGQVEYEIYSTGGVISYDENDIVRYEKDQVVQNGKFKLTETQLNSLWDAFNDNHFFELNRTYQMAIGNSYAFIMLEADDQKHMVHNIGVDVPEMRALVEAVDAMLPEGIDLDYAEG
jgi:predicted AlkP superfamily pyrophosphatase or phosphodiesterase